MKVELEGGCDAEIRAGASHCPKQVSVLVEARAQVVTCGRDNIHRAEIVAGQAVHSHQVPDTTAQRQAGYTGPRNRATGGGQPKCLRLSVDISPDTPGLYAHRLSSRVNPQERIRARSIIKPCSHTAFPATL